MDRYPELLVHEDPCQAEIEMWLRDRMSHLDLRAGPADQCRIRVDLNLAIAVLAISLAAANELSQEKVKSNALDRVTLSLHGQKSLGIQRKPTEMTPETRFVSDQISSVLILHPNDLTASPRFREPGTSDRC